MQCKISILSDMGMSHLYSQKIKQIQMPANDYLIANSLSQSQYCYTACSSARYVRVSVRVRVC